MPTTSGYDETTAVDPNRSHAEQVADMGAGVRQLPSSHHDTPFSMNNRSQKEFEVSPFSPSTPETPTYQKRRATLPSIIRASSEAANLAALWELQYSKQMATGDEQNLKLPARDSDIGVAVTSSAANNVNPIVGSTNFGLGNGNNIAAPKRRSRSAGALHDLVRSQSGMLVRKRSDEIRYWRQSLLPPAVTSLSLRSMKFNDGIDDSLIASPDTVPLAGPAYAGKAKTSDDAFDFQRSPDIKPISIEKEYSNRGPPSTPLQKRIDRLEAELATMERSMRQLKGRSHRQTVIMQEDSGPGKRRGRQSRWLPTGEHEQLQEDRPSSSDSSRTPPRLRSPFLPSVAGAKHWRRQHHSHSPSYRTSSNSQHHPYISAYTYGLSGEAPGSTQHRADPTAAAIADAAAAAAHEQVRALYLLLSQERSKRKALEVHVSALQRNVSDVRDIATAAMASAAKPHLYEMPVAPFSPNSHLPALTSQALAGEAAGLVGADPRRQTQVSRFSHFDSDDDIDGSGRIGQAGAVMSAGEYDDSEGASNTNRSSNTNNGMGERRRQLSRKSGRSSKNDENNDDGKNIKQDEEEEGDTTITNTASSEINDSLTRQEVPPEGLQQRRNRSELLNVDSVITEPLVGCPVAAAAVAVVTAAGIAPSTARTGESNAGAEDDDEGEEGHRVGDGGEGGGVLSSPSLNSPYTEDDFQTPDEELAPFSASFGGEGSTGQGLTVAGCN